LKRPLDIWDKHGFSYRFRTRNKVDYYLVTMNQSGTHWLEVMIAKALVDHYNLDYEFDSIEPRGIIDDADCPFDFEQKSIPRIQHSHFPYYFMFRNKKVILLIRDLRDSLVSRYEKYTQQCSNPKSFSEFLREGYVDNNGNKKNSLKQKVNFLNSWHKNKDKPERLLLVKYEDLKQEPVNKMKGVLSFLGLEVEESFVEKVVEFGSFDNMKKLASERLKNNKVVNKGKTGRHRNYFNKGNQKFFKEFLEQYLNNDFNYDY